jgi:hypothetical protein
MVPLAVTVRVFITEFIWRWAVCQRLLIGPVINPELIFRTRQSTAENYSVRGLKIPILSDYMNTKNDQLFAKLLGEINTPTMNKKHKNLIRHQ